MKNAFFTFTNKLSKKVVVYMNSFDEIVYRMFCLGIDCRVDKCPIAVLRERDSCEHFIMKMTVKDKVDLLFRAIEESPQCLDARLTTAKVYSKSPREHERFNITKLIEFFNKWYMEVK